MYCNHCGTEVEGEHTFCRSCGKPLGPAGGPVAAVPKPSRVQQHLQLLGILWIAYSAFKLLGAFAVFFVGRFIFGQIHIPEMPNFLPGLMSGIGWLLLAWSVVGIAAGWGLLQREPWARVLALVLAFLSLLNVPLGTALGVFTLVVLLPQEAGAEYEKLAGGP